MTGRTRFDFWAATFTVVATVVAFAIAIATPPKSGPFCVAGCVGFPYTDIAAFIPRDFVWMYPALLPAPMLVVMLSSIYEGAAADRRRFALLAMSFSLAAAALLTADYLVQLRAVQPAILRGELDGLAPLTQYNPYGVFIALEEAGYLLMAVAFGFAGAALGGQPGVWRAVRRVFVVGAAAVGLLFAGLSIAYGFDVEYRFEVAAIAVDWTVVIVTGALLAYAYRTTPDARG